MDSKNFRKIDRAATVPGSFKWQRQVIKEEYATSSNTDNFQSKYGIKKRGSKI